MDSNNENTFNARQPVEQYGTQSYKRLEFAVNRIIDVAIPIHLKTLEKQLDDIESYQIQGRWAFVRSEEVKASNTVRLLKSDIHELEQLNSYLRPEDAELFHKKIRIPTQKVVDTLICFVELHGDVMQPLPCVEDDLQECENTEIPTLKYNLQQKNDLPGNSLESPDNCCNLKQEGLQVEKPKVSKQWLKLRNDIIEINELIKKFAGYIWSQKESVNQIEDNVSSTHLNVQEGSKSLKKAAFLKATTIPMTGAVIGGLIFGPVGAVVGFKLCGTVACALTGSLVGYGAGKKWKQKHLSSCEFEMQALTAPPSKLCSVSLPDLSQTDCFTENDSTCKHLNVS